MQVPIDRLRRQLCYEYEDESTTGVSVDHRCTTGAHASPRSRARAGVSAGASAGHDRLASEGAGASASASDD